MYLFRSDKNISDFFLLDIYFSIFQYCFLSKYFCLQFLRLWETRWGSWFGFKPGFTEDCWGSVHLDLANIHLLAWFGPSGHWVLSDSMGLPPKLSRGTSNGISLGDRLRPLWLWVPCSYDFWATYSISAAIILSFWICLFNSVFVKLFSYST